MEPLLKLVALAVTLGVPLGTVLVTEWERKARRLPPPWLPFGRGSVLGMLFAVLLAKLPLLVALFLGVAFLVLRVFDLIPLRGDNSRYFFLAYLLAIGAGKLLRYGYWRWVFRGQFV